jgi:epoxyqueuosine reductase
MQNNHQISEAIKSKANSLGFFDCAILPTEFLAEEKVAYENWLGAAMQGKMSYMEKNKEKRLDPRKLFEGAKTIIVVLQNYFPGKTQMDSVPQISKYAYGTDYHFVLKEKLRSLLEFIQAEAGPCNGRPFVDSAPVLERAWARRAGLGWIGKNSNLISLEQGSFFFIAELILDIELPYDNPAEVNDHCGKCTRCIDACPTKAIVADRVVDSRLCISYQTIELKGELDENLKGKFENRIFGCDICQDVCPWNLKSVPHNEKAFFPHPDILKMNVADWFELEKPKFNELFRKSAVKRTGYKGLKRNLDFIQPVTNGEKN